MLKVSSHNKLIHWYTSIS